MKVLIRGIVLLGVIWVRVASAQSYSFLQYSVKEGLCQSQVRCVFQDSRGYLWAGTLGGLSRFDGNAFRNYSRHDGLSNNQINTIIELGDHRIAAGSVGGVSLVSALGVETIPVEGNGGETSVNALWEGTGGALWIGTEDGLFVWEKGVVGAAKIDGLPPEVHVKSFFKFSGGDLGVVAKDAVYRISGRRATEFYRPKDKEVHLFDAEWDQSGNLLIAARQVSLIRIRPDGSESLISPAGGWAATTMTGITRGAGGRIWLSSRIGAFLMDGDSIRFFSERDGLPTPDIRDIIIDREGNTWMASYGSGLLRFAGLAFSTYSKKEGLSSDAVMSITSDRSGTVWFSTFDQGICKLSGDSVVPVAQTDISGSNRIWTSLTAEDGTLWFGSSDGLFRYDGRRFRQYTTSDGLPDRMVLCLAKGDGGVLYVGTAAGLAIVKNDAISTLTAVPGMPSSRVRGIAADRSGDLWLATRDGVFHYNGTRVNRMGLEHGLPDLSSYCIISDPANRIWVGTQTGLAVWEGSRFRTVPLDEQSGARTINFLKVAQGRLWVGTLNGIYSCSLEEAAGKAPGWTQYGVDDGLRSLETNLNAVYEDFSGQMWFGTPEGVVRLNIQELERPQLRVSPAVHLTGILINLMPPDWKKLKVQPDPVTGYPPGLEVGHKYNHFTFYCDAISTSYPDKLEYQYWLEGLEDDWEPVTSASFVTYSNLPHDEFVFRVRARSNHGEWSDPVVYPISIRPPFWMTWWFVLIEIVAVVSLTGAIVRVRQRTMRERQEMEMSELKSRMLILEQQSLNSSMNRHFIFNALNSIQYYINRQDRLAANRYLTDFARLIRKNLDSSQENLTSLRDEVERLELYLKLEHMRFRDKFEYRIQVDPALNQDEIKVPAMLLQPFLENSIWHGLLPKDAHGVVEVVIRKTGDRIEFVITDNGIGIDNSLLSKSGTDNHISKGMQITGSRIELIRKMTGANVELRGPYQMHNEANEPIGTRVCITMPLEFHELFLG